ncbi:unnamed protein product, partial [Rotaria sp. Silwood2]
NIFDMEEVVDSFGQIYRLPNIFLQHINGTWLDSSLELNNELYEILISNQMQRLTNRVYRLSTSFSYFYSNSLSINDRNYLQKLILILFNQQNSIISNDVKILYEDLYLNKTSMKIIRRIYLFVFYNGQVLDGRYLSSFILSSEQFNGIDYIQNPLNYKSNQILIDVIKQRDIQQITFSGKISKLSAERILKDYWQNPIKQDLPNTIVDIIQLQEYLAYSSNQFYTTITYRIVTFDDYTIPDTCFNASLFQTMHSLCDTENYFMEQVPIGYIPSFIDLKGSYLQFDLDEENFPALITSSLQRMGISGEISSILTEPRFGLDMALLTRVYYTIIPNQIISQEQLYDKLKLTFSTIQTRKYELYPMEQLSIVRTDAHQYIANVSLPINDFIRKDTENYLTSLNPQYGQAKIVYAETLNINQTRFYLTFINQKELITRCDFRLYYPGVSTNREEYLEIHSLYLERHTFFAKSASLIDSLTQLWTNENLNESKNLSIQLQNQIQYICSDGNRSVRIDYMIKNLAVHKLKLPSNSAFEKVYGKFSNNCISYEVRSIYLIEPRLSHREIHEALENAWRQSNNNFPIKISSEFFMHSSYITNKNKTLTRLIYTINSNTLRFIQPLPNSIHLPSIYTDIPYKRSTIYVENEILNSTILSMINKALRLSWSKANSYLFSPNDVFISSINTVPCDNGQIKIDYIIGLRSGDIDDYCQPSEQLYSQIFNDTNLTTLVYLRYIQRSSNEILLNTDQLALFPFDSRSHGPFYAPDWWIILIIVIAILIIWLILCVVCYICFRKRSTNRYHHKISKRPTRHMDILAREQDHYLRPSLSSLAYDGPYAESFNSSADDQQRISTRTISSQPELQVRRLSEQDWPHFAMHNPYGWSSLLLNSPSHSTNSNRPL